MSNEPSTTRVLRWDLPVDDAWHEIGTGPVVLVAIRDLPHARTGTLVEVWTREPTQRQNVSTRHARVYGTGHHVPMRAEHIGSVVVPGVRLVWHAFAEPAPIDTTALAEQGRRLASQREDLIAQGVDPNDLPIPLHPDTPNGPR